MKANEGVVHYITRGKELQCNLVDLEGLSGKTFVSIILKAKQRCSRFFYIDEVKQR